MCDSTSDIDDCAALAQNSQCAVLEGSIPSVATCQCIAGFINIESVCRGIHFIRVFFKVTYKF